MERAAEGDGAHTRGFSENDLNITDLNALPSITSGQVDPELRLLELSGEAVGSSSDVSSTTSSEVALLIDLSVNDSKDSEETDSPAWLTELEKPEGDTEVEPATTHVAGGSEHSAVYTQSPKTIVDLDSGSETNYQSDSTTDSYFLVSADTMCAAGVEVLESGVRHCRKDAHCSV